MTLHVNLLPESYRRAQRHAQQVRWAMMGGTALLVAELAIAAFLQVRAGDKRSLESAKRETDRVLRAQSRELKDLTQQVATVARNLVLARNLRSAHRWSRFLAALARATPEHVVLTSVTTDPVRWAADPGAPKEADRPAVSADAPAKGRVEPPLRPLLRGVLLRGYAMDHQALSQFMTTIHGSKLFTAIDLKRMQREPVDGTDMISFELQGHW